MTDTVNAVRDVHAVGSGQMSDITAILDLARWAPSGDNTQPWRFRIDGPDRVLVLGHDTRTHCVYDLDGHASQISHGALLETIALAASRFGKQADIVRRSDSSDAHPVYEVSFSAAPGVTEDALVPEIEQRRVQRRGMPTRPLSADEKRELERAVAPSHRLVWFERFGERAAIARLNFQSAKIRLTIPEAYPTHRDIIEWGVDRSEDRIPAPALGASGPTLGMMKWALGSWQRVAFMNRYMAGTVLPRVELDLRPALACAAHTFFVAEKAPTSIDDYVGAGRALQRYWLTASRLGLQFQPEYTPVIFARYLRERVRFTESASGVRMAESVARRLVALLGRDVAERAMFVGRVGSGAPAASRSVRLPLARLMADAPAA